MSRSSVAALVFAIVAACSPYAEDNRAAKIASASEAKSTASTTAACWVETAHMSIPIRGPVTASGILIRHPKGHLLIDGGSSTHYDEEIRPYAGSDRLFYETITRTMKPSTSLPAALRKIGTAPEQVTWFLPSHIHIDHVGGMMDMPDVPVLLSDAEADLLRRGLSETRFEVVPAHAERLRPLVKPLAFTAQPYEGFTASLDFFGDRSVILVPLPGHTPGSVGIFITLRDGSRVFHVGDTINSLAQLESGDAKWWPLSRTDSDPDETLERVHELRALAARAPDLHFIPAHDRAAWENVFQHEGGCIAVGPNPG